MAFADPSQDLVSSPDQNAPDQYQPAGLKANHALTLAI